MRKKINFVLLSLLILCLAVSVVNAQNLPKPIVEYNFNGTGTEVVSTGIYEFPLKLVTAKGDTDLHSRAGMGVSGEPNDRAFDNSKASRMGQRGTGYGRAVSQEKWLDVIGFQQFLTIQGWFKAENPFDAGAVLSVVPGVFDVRHTSNVQGVMRFMTYHKTLVNVTSPPVYNRVGEWVFYAITWDGSKTKDNVKFYLGSTREAVRLISTGSLDVPMEYDNNSHLFLGDTNVGDPNTNFIRPFDGYIDNVRVFGSDKDTTGILSLEQLEQIRTGDLGTNHTISQIKLEKVFDNYSFEKDEGWGKVFINQATGQVERDDSKARSGSYAMKMEKTNSTGHIILRTKEPIRVQANQTYYFRGYFHSEDAPISSLLLFRVGAKSDNLSYDSIDRSAGYTSQSLIPNSPDGKWEKRVVTYKANQDQDVYLQMVLYGNPCTVWIDDLEFTTTPATIVTAPPNEYSFPYTEDEVCKIMKERVSLSAKVAERDGISRLLINDEIALPVTYKTAIVSNEKTGDYEAFAKDGINTQHVFIKLGPSSNPSLAPAVWTGKDQYDFSLVEEEIINVLRKNPNANLIVELFVYPYKEWGFENPSEIKLNNKGEPAYASWINVEGYGRNLNANQYFYPSYESLKWREDASKALEELVTHLKKHWTWKSVVGFSVFAGQDGQSIAHDYDYSEPSQKNFQNWCQNKYGSIDNLNRAWKSRYTSFEQIKIPEKPSSYEQLPPHLELGPLVEYRIFKEEKALDLVDHFAGVVKESAGKPVVVMTYGYGRIFTKNFFATKNLDIAANMTYYPYRNLGYTLGWRQNNAFNLHSKLLLQEVDFRSWVGSKYDEVRQMWMGIGESPDEWDNMHKKLIGASIAGDYGYWYFDMNNYYSNDWIHGQISETIKVHEQLKAREKTFRPDVAVVICDDAMKFISADQNSLEHVIISYQDMMLETSGVPHDVLLLNDVLEREELQDYKVYIFYNIAYIAAADREKIELLLKNNNRTLVWMHNTGYISEQGKSAVELSKLVGMNVKTLDQYSRLTPQIISGSHTIVENVLPFQSVSELYMATFILKGSSGFSARYQPFWIEDSSAQALAKYEENGRVAMAIKNKPQWTSIYLGAANSLGNDLLHKIALDAGAYVYGKPGQSVFMNENFMSIHGMKTEDYTIILPPGKNTVIDAETGEVLARCVDTFTTSIEAQKTYWFIFE